MEPQPKTVSAHSSVREEGCQRQMLSPVWPGVCSTWGRDAEVRVQRYLQSQSHVFKHLKAKTLHI